MKSHRLSYLTAALASALAVLSLFSWETARAKEREAAVVTKEVTSVIQALYKADYDLLVKHTHENVLKLSGGKEGFVTVMKQTNKLLKDAGVSIAKIEYGKKIEYFTGKEREFLIIPTTITITTAEGNQVIPGVQLGVKKKTDKIWKYLDCSALDEKMAREWFPDFPKDRKFPEG